MINPLIIVRDIHLASSVMVAGIVFFDLLVASPVLRKDPRLAKAESSFREAAGKLLWGSLALSIISAAVWLCLLSARIAGRSIAEVIADGTVWMVLTQTQFGLAWEIRLLLACLLAACLLLRLKAHEGPAATQLLIAACLLAAAYLDHTIARRRVGFDVEFGVVETFPFQPFPHFFRVGTTRGSK